MPTRTPPEDEHLTSFIADIARDAGPPCQVHIQEYNSRPPAGSAPIAALTHSSALERAPTRADPRAGPSQTDPQPRSNSRRGTPSHKEGVSPTGTSATLACTLFLHPTAEHDRL